ncbi:MAG: Na/Pi cotransporter family protein [Clostridia bacterium]|nr:Na/Pi cotransporter family protein [Clostridia bacterium]
MTISNTIALLGGLGFFLFGMSLLGEGLKRVAGSKLEIILEKLTSTTFRGVLLGSLVTAVIQSSSATTVMVVGFVNSGIMKLTNAIGIIMGANIGTTATGWLLVLSGIDGGGLSSATIFAFVAFVGIILYFFCKDTTKKNVGMILLALSVLMSGMQSMSAAMSPLKESPAFLNFISAVSNPLVAIAVGIVVTAIIQSCSASIGILQALSVTGVISYEVAVPMVLGMCIGACVPVLLSAIGANINGKRTAFIYLYFNLAGSLLLMIPFYLIHGLVGLGFMAATATSMGIAIVNTVYKVSATVLLTPCAPLLEKAVVATIREKHSPDDEEMEESLLDERFLEYPPLALEQCGKTLEQMSDAAFKNLRRAMELLDEFDQKKFQKILQREDRIDHMEDRLGNYLVRLTAKELSAKETRASAKYLTCLSNLERISDHAVNLAELAQELAQKSSSFSPQAHKELHICMDAVAEIACMTQQVLTEDDLVQARLVEPLEEVIDMLTRDLKTRHIQRLQAGQCTLELGFVFNDCINNFERVADHCSNLAIAVLEETGTQLQPHDYMMSIKSGDSDYRKHFDECLEKYCGALEHLN